LSQSPAAPPATRQLGARQAFGQLIDDFRGRLDREIAAFLGAKRAAAHADAAAGAPDDSADLTAHEARPGAANPLADPADLVDGVARLIAHGGKRLRPALVHYTYRACGGRSEEQSLPLALATEFLHTYLLIHDDIMDHAALRRGQPAAHVRFHDLHRAAGLRGDGEDFGRSVAILRGDLAHTYAVELFTTAVAAAGPAAAAAPATPGQWAEVNRCFSRMCEEVIGGQYLELLLAHRPWETATAPAAATAGAGDPRGATDLAAVGAADAPAGATAAGEAARAPREAELLRILRLKSGRYSAERPIQLGALLACAPRPLRAALSRYGAAVGEAFQLQDDLLGVFGDPATTGKPVGDDLREGKVTFLVHHALAAGAPGDRQLLIASLGRPDLTAAEIAGLQEVIERTGARRAVTAMVAERLNAARRALEAVEALAAPASGPGAAAPGTREDTSGALRSGPGAGRPAHQAEGLLFLSGLLDDLWERER
jgi:geranylgeranyl diphosphate synthase type I